MGSGLRSLVARQRMLAYGHGQQDHSGRIRLAVAVPATSTTIHVCRGCAPLKSFPLNHSTADAAEKGSSYDTVPSPCTGCGSLLTA